jgi:hypothetical protein
MFSDQFHATAALPLVKRALRTLEEKTGWTPELLDTLDNHEALASAAGRTAGRLAHI